jgi:hypothetical protein
VAKCKDHNRLCERWGEQIVHATGSERGIVCGSERFAVLTVRSIGREEAMKVVPSDPVAVVVSEQDDPETGPVLPWAEHFAGAMGEHGDEWHQPGNPRPHSHESKPH